MKTLILSVSVGATTSLLGVLCEVGGGIVIIPAFTLLMKLEHKFLIGA